MCVWRARISVSKIPRSIICTYSAGGRARTKRGRTERTRAIVLYICIYCVRVSVAHFPRDIMRSCCAWLACRARAIVCMQIYRYCGYGLRSCCCAVLSAVPCWCGLLSAVPLALAFPCALVSCCSLLLLYGVIVLQCAVIAFPCLVV